MSVAPNCNGWFMAINVSLQLGATDIDNLSFVDYTWSLFSCLDDVKSRTPIALIDRDRTYIVTGITPNGCKATNAINIKVFAKADISVPTAFTPNGDNNNDVLRPVLVGIKELKYFTVYNRYGEIVYKTSTQKAGWNGFINGKMQNTGSYVWVAEAIDYKGNVLLRKCMATLIH